MAGVLVFAGVVAAADLHTEAVLSSDATAPTEVEHGDNGFVIKVWLTGNLQSGRTGKVNIVNKYFMDDNGDITPSTDTDDVTELTFQNDFHYTQGCVGHPLGQQSGCAANPKTVNAVLNVHADAPVGTEGELTVAGNFDNFTNNGIDELDDDASWDIGFVVVVAGSGDDYTFDGFYQPVGDHTTATNGFFITAKAGQGIALKWNLLDSEEEPVTEGTWTAKSTKYSVGCFDGSNGDDPNTVPDAGSAGSSDFRYDPDGDGQWIFVWKTNKGWANTCRTFELSYNGSPVAELDVHFTK